MVCWSTAEGHEAGVCREMGSGGRTTSELGGGSAGGLGAPEKGPGSASLCGGLGGGLAGGVPGVKGRGAASVARSW